MRKDKKQVIGEDMTDEQVRHFLEGQPPVGVDADFHALERAYRGLRAHDFERFLAFFRDAGRNVNATDAHGRTLADIIATHANGGDYLELLRRAGGR